MGYTLMSAMYNAFASNVTKVNHRIAGDLSKQRGLHTGYVRTLGARLGEVDEVIDRAIFKVLRSKSLINPAGTRNYFRTILRTTLFDYWKKDSKLRVGQDLSEDPNLPEIGSELLDSDLHPEAGRGLPASLDEIDEAIQIIYPNPDNPRRQLYEMMSRGHSIMEVVRERGIDNRSGVDSQWTHTKRDIREYFQGQRD